MGAVDHEGTAARVAAGYRIPQPWAGWREPLTLATLPLGCVAPDSLRWITAEGRVRGQIDSPPLGGARPATGCVPSEYLWDEYQLVVDPEAVPGEQIVEVRMCDASPPDFQRLPLVDVAGNVLEAVVRVEGS